MAHIRPSGPDSGVGTVLDDLIRTSVYDEYSGATTIATHLDHIGHCKTVSGPYRSNRWTYRAFIINTRRVKIYLEGEEVVEGLEDDQLISR